MSAAELKAYCETQPKVYGLHVASFVSEFSDSIFYLTPGRIKPDKRLLAVFSFIKRRMGYELLLDVDPSEYLQYGYAKVEHPWDENIELKIGQHRHKGYASVTYFEF